MLTPGHDAAGPVRREITVVKLGGSLLEDAGRRGRVLAELAARRRAGGTGGFVLVHGGGRRIDAELSARGIPRRIHRGLRVTDETTLEVVISVLCGLVNKRLVCELRALGLSAAGICGADGPTLEAVPYTDDSGVDYGRVGRVARADPSLVSHLVEAGWLPVMATLAAGADGCLNVNADAAADALAAALKARRLVFLTDVPGFLDADGRVVARLTRARAEALLREDAVRGGMRPKLAACLHALDSGVGSVYIAGADNATAVLDEREGGTTLVHA